MSGYTDHTRCSKKKKFNRPFHLRVEGLLGKVERWTVRVKKCAHSALPCNNLQLDAITHNSRVIHTNLKKAFWNKALHLRTRWLHALLCSRKSLNTRRYVILLSPRHRHRSRKLPVTPQFCQRYTSSLYLQSIQQTTSTHSKDINTLYNSLHTNITTAVRKGL